jgi:hypothetical protein
MAIAWKVSMLLVKSSTLSGQPAASPPAFEVATTWSAETPVETRHSPSKSATL